MRTAASYHFHSVWTVDAPSNAAYAALYEVVDYPRWWPEVKEARKLDEDHLWMRTRAVLPYDLVFMLIRRVADPRSGILEARLEGDTSMARSAGRSRPQATGASSASTSAS